jgi:hypothetical protein
MLHSRSRDGLAAAAAWLLSNPPDLHAQSVLSKFEGDSAQDSFGLGVAGVGDVDVDGLADVAIGAYLDDPNGADSGRLQVFSGFDGHVILALDGPAAGDWFGRAVGRAGDVNGDGHADFVAGASRSDANGSDSGTAIVFSGKDGSALFTVQGAAGDYLGWAVSGGEDVDLDGLPDFAISAHDHVTFSKADYVLVCSGKDGSVLLRFDGDHSGHTLGNAVALLGDVNGDGHADVLAGAGFDDRVAQDAGSVRLFSGADGAILFDLDGEAARDRFGNTLAAAGDVDADGIPDFVVGANGTNVNGIDSGTAYVYSGRDASLIFRVDGADGGDFLANASGVGDLNGDGHAELLIGAPSASSPNGASGVALLVSGFSGSTLYRFAGESDGDFFGREVGFVGDADGDGLEDLLVAAPASDEQGTGAGSAYLLRGNDLFLQAAKSGVLPGDTLRLNTRGGAPKAAAALFIMAIDGVMQTSLVEVNQLNAKGDWRFTATVPSGLSGHSISFRSYAIGPTGKVVDSEEEVVSFL